MTLNASTKSSQSDWIELKGSKIGLIFRAVRQDAEDGDDSGAAEASFHLSPQEKVQLSGPLSFPVKLCQVYLLLIFYH